MLSLISQYQCAGQFHIHTFTFTHSQTLVIMADTMTFSFLLDKLLYSVLVRECNVWSVMSSLRGVGKYRGKYRLRRRLQFGSCV